MSAPAWELDTPVRLVQREREFSELLDLYRERAPRRVLEVGVFEGGTLYHWLKNAEPGAVVVALDTFTLRDHRETFTSWVPAGVTLVTIEGDSTLLHTAKRVEAFGPFDWIFIDGSHAYDDVAQDWHLYGTLAAVHGLVIFHDIRHHDEEIGVDVEYLWREIVEAGFDTREIIDPETNGGPQWGGIGIVQL